MRNPSRLSAALLSACLASVHFVLSCSTFPGDLASYRNFHTLTLGLAFPNSFGTQRSSNRSSSNLAAVSGSLRVEKDSASHAKLFHSESISAGSTGLVTFNTKAHSFCQLNSSPCFERIAPDRLTDSEGSDHCTLGFRWEFFRVNFMTP